MAGKDGKFYDTIEVSALCLLWVSMAILGRNHFLYIIHNIAPTKLSDFFYSENYVYILCLNIKLDNYGWFV